MSAPPDRPESGMNPTIRSALVLLAGVVAAVPHPTWLWPAGIILIPAAGWAATRMASPK